MLQELKMKTIYVTNLPMMQMSSQGHIPDEIGVVHHVCKVPEESMQKYYINHLASVEKYGGVEEVFMSQVKFRDILTNEHAPATFALGFIIKY